MMKSQLKEKIKGYNRCIDNIYSILSESDVLDKDKLVSYIRGELSSLEEYLCNLESLYSYYDRWSHK